MNKQLLSNTVYPAWHQIFQNQTESHSRAGNKGLEHQGNLPKDTASEQES